MKKKGKVCRRLTKCVASLLSAAMLIQTFGVPAWENGKVTMRDTVITAEAAAPRMTIEQMKQKFPHGAYWNHIVTYNNHQDANPNYYEPCNNENGYTWQPCASHSRRASIGQADCNAITPAASQCCGFANKVAKDVYGADPRYNWPQTTNRGSIKSGDVIHYYGAGADASWGHWVIVIGTSGDNLILGECNIGSNCKISWGRYLNRYSPSSMTIYSAPYDWSTASISKPAAPGNLKIGAADLGIGDSLSVSWSAPAGATGYNVQLQCTTNSAYNQTKSVGGTSTSFILNHSGTYRIQVSANNSAGSSSVVTSGNCVVHPNVTVTYKDYDGSVIKTQSVKYGGNSSNPLAPTREGYTFQGWSHDGKNLTKDTVITAQYKINTYTVKFVDYKGEQIGESQRIEHGKSAAAPEEIPAAPGYVFSSWNTDAYKCVTGNLTVQATYVWENVDLPIITEIKSAARNEEKTGYNITVKMTNFPSDFTKGKIVTTLKTAQGKMVASEIDAVSFPVSGELEKEIFVLYSGVATQVEVSMIGVVDDDTTGTPKSKAVSGIVDIGNEWSEWSGEEVTDDNVIKESRTEYRYKDKKVIKAVSQPSTPSGYTYESYSKTGTYTAWGAWSGWSTNAYYNSTLVNAESATFYRYYAFVCPHCGARDPYSGNCSNCGGGGLYWVEDWGITSGYAYGYQAMDSAKGRIYWNNNYWYFEFNGASNGGGGTGQPTRTQWRYRTRQEYNNYVYWQTDFSDWQPEKVTASNDRKVETRTAYRYKTNSAEATCYNYKRYKYQNLNNGETYYTYSSVYPDSMGYVGEWEYKTTFEELEKVSTVDGNIDLYNGIGENSWYRADVNDQGDMTVYEGSQSMEDQTGTKRVIEGTVLDAAGKSATLMVYKGKNEDPTASQLEYVGQTTIGEDGKYYFEFITKEEPTAEIGDFVVTLGIEGATNYINLDVIEAPKATYTVQFVDDEGKTIDTQQVLEGENAKAPEAPAKEGYEFVGWDTGLNNVRDNLTVTATYKKQVYTVVFVDWDNTTLEIAQFEYGDELSIDKIPEQEGKEFSKWITQEGEEALKVTQNMIVTASYVDARYLVKFLDWDGEVISEQELTFGEAAVLPEIEEPKEEGLKFSHWSSNGEEEFVTRDLTITPVAEFTETAEEPVFSINDGTYDEAQKVFLSCGTPGAKIYYYLYDAETADDEIYAAVKHEGTLYSSPIEISEDSVIYAYAEGDEVNRSEMARLEIHINETEKEELAITEQPEDFKGQIGDVAIFTIKASGDNLTYQWQYQNADSTGWSNSSMTGSRTATVAVPITEDKKGQKYRCVIRDEHDNIVVSNVVSIILAEIDNPFTDVFEYDYYYEPVLWAYQNGITSGIDSTHFVPDQACTRGQVVTFLWRAMGKPEPESDDNPFVDLQKGTYYYNAVLWAYQNGITAGIDKTHFAPDDTVTRGQFVTFLYRAKGTPDYSVENPFIDVQNGTFYKDAVLWAYENGITSGNDATHFLPDQDCTRGQVAAFLYRSQN